MDREMDSLQQALSLDGFVMVPGALDRVDCAAIARNLSSLPGSSGGLRNLLTEPWCRLLATRLQNHGPISTAIAASFEPVQCTYFEKSAERNWLVPIHQDLSIPVRERVEAQGLQGWSWKDGAHYVQAPVDVLQQLVAVRLHLDPCGSDDGPLAVVPGTHLMGRLSSSEAIEIRNTRAERSCTAEAGDALLMRPLLLHSSSKSAGSSRRRVLHFLFGPPGLPLGLTWRNEVGQ